MKLINMFCPCGTNAKFENCCELIILKKAQAKSPEQLMRSRYSAYAVKNIKYIYDTYSSVSQKRQSLSEIAQWSKDTTWLNLKIIKSSSFQNSNKPKVEFQALYKQNNTFYKMQEESVFIKENNEWRYSEGNNVTFSEMIQPKRNDECICSSSKKFKKCCGI